MTAKLLIISIAGGITLAASIIVSSSNLNSTNNAGLTFKAVQNLTETPPVSQNKTLDARVPAVTAIITQTPTPFNKNAAEQTAVISTPYSTPQNNENATAKQVHENIENIASDKASEQIPTFPPAVQILPTPSFTPTLTPSSALQPLNQTPNENLKNSCKSGQVNINTAPKEELTRIKHIGDVRAEELINLRPFETIDDMAKIKGIGPSRLKDIKSEGIACV